MGQTLCCVRSSSPLAPHRLGCTCIFIQNTTSSRTFSRSPGRFPTPLNDLRHSGSLDEEGDAFNSRALATCARAVCSAVAASSSRLRRGCSPSERRTGVRGFRPSGWTGLSAQLTRFDADGDDDAERVGVEPARERLRAAWASISGMRKWRCAGLGGSPSAGSPSCAPSSSPAGRARSNDETPS